MRHYAGRNPDQSTMAETMGVIGKLVLFATVAYGLLAIGAHFLSLNMIFPRPPVKYEMGPEIITLTSPDGTKLAARHWPLQGAKYTILYLHGNYEDLGSIAEYIPGFTKAGYALFAFDYRGYGHSEGTPNEKNLCADTRLAYEYLRTKLGVPADRIIVFGYSLGGGPGVELALHQPVAGLVLQGAFVSAYRVMTNVPVLPGDKFRNLAKVPQLRCPVLMIHGTADGTVPFWHGERLYDAISAPKQKLFVEGGHHGGLADFAGQAYPDALNKFASSLR
jgi:fermentation-respiration switch protein FrsA (DUF1100 family)